jgi:hypothetical protein
MRFLKLTLSLFLPVILLVSGAMASVARAESPSARLALAKDPAPAKPSMVETPKNTRMSDTPAPADSDSKHSAWWVWAVIAAGVAGVAALAITSSGKDPGCPSDRVCH